MIKEDYEKRIEELRPWRYNHTHEDIVIKADNPTSSRIHDQYGKSLLIHILEKIVGRKKPQNIRVLDIGCLEGHYSDIFCSYGFKEVVSIDLSKKHVARSNFLLKELKKYQNSTIIEGNVLDENLMLSLGNFNIIFFHGLLYHLKNPVGMFDIIEHLLDQKEESFVLLSHQFHMKYANMISPFSLAEMQVRPFQLDRKGLVFSPKDKSVFERISVRLNAQALYKLLRAYNYSKIIAYNTPMGIEFKNKNFAVNLVLAKNVILNLAEELNTNLDVPDTNFYNWQGDSADSYHFKRKAKALLIRIALRILYYSAKLFSWRGIKRLSTLPISCAKKS